MMPLFLEENVAISLPLKKSLNFLSIEFKGKWQGPFLVAFRMQKVLRKIKPQFGIKLPVVAAANSLKYHGTLMAQLGTKNANNSAI